MSGRTQGSLEYSYDWTLSGMAPPGSFFAPPGMKRQQLPVSCLLSEELSAVLIFVCRID